MKRLTLVLISLCCAAPALAADGPPIIDFFGCTLTDGRTMADFDRAAAVWASQADSNPANRDYFAAVLKPFRGAYPYDVIWIGATPSMTAWSQANAAPVPAEEQAALAGIDATVKCESAVFAETAMYEGLKGESGDRDTVIEAYVCSLAPGKTARDAEAADKTFSASIQAVRPANFSLYRWTPIYDKASVHVVYMTANDDFDTFGAAFEAWVSSKEGPTADAAIKAALSCDLSIWLGHVLRQPAPATRS